MILEYFPEVFIQLQLEIQRRHPRLMQRFQKHQQTDIEIVLAECCTYVGIAINAELDGEQLEILAEQLLKRLQDILNPMPPMTNAELILNGYADGLNEKLMIQ